MKLMAEMSHITDPEPVNGWRDELIAFNIKV